MKPLSPTSVHPSDTEIKEFQDKLGVSLEVFLKNAHAAGLTHMKMPPPSVEEMGTEYLAGDFSTWLAAKFPFQPRYENPVGYYQGGMLGAAFDNVMGPLSYMAFNGPCVTLELHTRFVRPFRASDSAMIIQCYLTSLTKNILTIRGEAHTYHSEPKKRKLIALASCTSIRT